MSERVVFASVLVFCTPGLLFGPHLDCGWPSTPTAPQYLAARPPSLADLPVSRASSGGAYFTAMEQIDFVDLGLRAVEPPTTSKICSRMLAFNLAHRVSRTSPKSYQPPRSLSSVA
ncbi:hypothetical protein BU16DRAFT_615057 [Lophium mytilinum]|uniref:Secreted protein n=1 Tax=Lophium mytilinum TaxID=390894 RepID=A0A6A6R895_9PEZI|nr:hypothetical protein BU16DRAFT_615057 [Lophium mytilinum]